MLRHRGQIKKLRTHCPQRYFSSKGVKSVSVEATRSDKEDYNSLPPTALEQQGRKSINVEAPRSDKVG